MDIWIYITVMVIVSHAVFEGTKLQNYKIGQLLERFQVTRKFKFSFKMTKWGRTIIV